jgi:RNA polymerase sigma-70 factor (ECF subfamily)
VASLESDIALVHAARSGDRAAFSRLYERFAPMVHSILLARVSPADADDLVQDVFVRAMTKIDALSDPGAVGAWLGTIARNAAAAFYRSRRPAAELPEAAAASGAAAGSEHAEAEEALAAIRSLPEAYRETLLMRLVEGLSGPEIAARTGLTPGSVRVNLHRGMAMLRERLGAGATTTGARA